MSRIEELRKEEAELEKLMYEGEEENPAEVKPESAPFTDEVENLTPDGATEEATETETPEAKKTRVSWKKRHTSYKTATDHTIYTLRQENAALKAGMAEVSESTNQLRKEILALKTAQASNVDPLEGVITQEDTDVIGPEAVEIIKKVALAKQKSPELDSLRAELDVLKAERNRNLKTEAKNIQAKSFEDLKNKLTEVVPDWLALDNEAQFKVYMEEGYDQFSGKPRMGLFHSAMKSGDVTNVARFYNEYKSLKPESKESILEKKVTPVAAGADTPSLESKKTTYSIGEYTDFYDSLNTGTFKGTAKEARELQHVLDTAFVQGRIVD